MKKSYIFSVLLISFLTSTDLSADAVSGADLFQGTKSFENGAVACIACHSVDSNLVASGGKLAMNLTALGGAGVEYSITKPENASSAIMREAFKGKPLTASEISDLVDFFNKVPGAKAVSNPYSFVIKGVAGAVVIFILFSFLGRNRKKESVNQKIYDRQLKTSWKETRK